MKASTYNEERAKNRSEAHGLHVEWMKIHDEKMKLYEERHGYEFDSTDYLWCDEKLYALDLKLASVKAKRDALDAKDDELTAFVEGGFDYERPGNRLINRLLPPLAEGTTVVYRKSASRSTKWFIVAALVFATVLSFAVKFFGSVVGFWFLPFMTHVTGLASSSLIVVILAMGGAAYIYAAVTYVSSDFTGQAALDERQRYLFGSEDWTWLQRLRSCLVYGVASPFVLYAPIVTIAFRFCTMAFGMAVYLKCVRTEQKEALRIVARGSQLAMGVLLFLFGVIAIVASLTVYSSI